MCQENLILETKKHEGAEMAGLLHCYLYSVVKEQKQGRNGPVFRLLPYVCFLLVILYLDGQLGAKVGKAFSGSFRRAFSYTMYF